MSDLLEKCTSCARHVRQSEASCPFCGVVLPASFRVRRGKPRPAGRLSRAALWALGASSVGVVPLTACGSDDSFVSGEPDASLLDAAYGGPPIHEDAAPETTDAAYGGPPVDLDAADADGGPMGSLDAAYGAPPPHDGGGDGGLDASDAGDADAD